MDTEAANMHVMYADDDQK